MSSVLGCRLRRRWLWSTCVACAVGFWAGYARGQEENELAAAIENTGERIDVVGTKLADLGDRALEILPLLGVGILTVIGFWIIARLITSGDWLFLWIDNRFVRDMVQQMTRIAIVGAGVLVALELLDATSLVGATLGAAGVVGVAIGFAFRDIAENYLAGLLLSVRHPFGPNDLVSIDGDEGKVVRLTSRATVLLTLDGNHLRIPNAKVFKAVVLNYSRNPMRRFDFAIGVGARADLAAAQKLGVEVLKGMDAVVDEPVPLALLEQLGDSNVPISFYAWVDQRETDYFKAKSEGIRLVKAAFDDASIEMPAPILEVQVVQDSGTPPQPASAPGGQLAEAGDTAADDTLDEQVESERAEEGPDLLDEDAPRE